jgi:hypothetical protein
LDRKLGGPQSRSGSCGEEKNLSPTENRTLAIHTVARRDGDSSFFINIPMYISDMWSLTFTLMMEMGEISETLVFNSTLAGLIDGDSSL